MSALIACLRVPDLPLAAQRRAEPGLAGRPLAVAAGRRASAELLCVSPEAQQRGVRPLQSVARARSACAGLCVRIASPALEDAAREALVDVALSFSPRAAAAPPAAGARAHEAAVFLDAQGLPGTPAGLAAALAERAARLGLPGTVGIAASRSTARIAARSLGSAPGAVRVIEPGGEAEFLAPLPVDVLDPDDELADALTRFGVRRVGELLRLPRRALATRLGAQALALVRSALGDASDPLLPVPTPSLLAEAIDLEYPVLRLEPLAFVLRGVLSRLLARLALRHLACGELSLSLDLAEGGRDARRVGVAAPTRDERVLLRLVCHALEARPPADAVLGVRIEAEGRPLRADQLDLFRPAGPAPAQLAPALAELEALCGEGHVGAPRVADSHHPEAFELARFEPGRAPEPDPPPTASPLALRRLRPALPAEVRLAGGRPVWLQSALTSGPVVRAAGPWRVTGGWWSADRFAFDHFDVQTGDGTVVRLRFDHVLGAWHVDAVYD